MGTIYRSNITPIIFGFLAFGATISNSAQAGSVSRSCAPVGAQESITVNWNFQPGHYWTASQHYRNGKLLHTPNSGWAYTWRSYAGHFGKEFWYGHVRGYHWAYKLTRGVYSLGITNANDCNLKNWGGG